jgi:hypothetical protein
MSLKNPCGIADVCLTAMHVALLRTKTMTNLGRLAVVCLLLGSFVVSVLASSDPTLHHLLHHDSAAPVHQCLATKLSDGQNDVTHPTIVVWNPGSFSFAVVPVQTSVPCFHADLSSAPRGPPVLS